MNTSTAPSIHTPICALEASGSRRRICGFTLIELLVVVAIAAILVGVATPAMTSTVRSVKLSSASNDLLGALLMARSESIKRNIRVAVCKSADGNSCALTGGWEQGWIVFQDTNNTGTHDGSEAVIAHQQAMSSDMRVTGNQSVARYVSYAPTGATKLAGGGFQAGTITLCRQSALGGEARQIILSSAGRPRVQKTLVSSCG